MKRKSRKAKPALTLGDRALVTPCDGRRVICPKSMAPLPEDGAVRTIDQYWLRRVADGDVTLGPVDAKVSTSAPAPAVSNADSETPE